MRAVALVILLASTVRGQDEPQPTPEQRIAALEKENLALKRKVEVLRNLIDEMVARQAGEKHTMRVTIPADPDPEHLRGILLPGDPSKQDCRLYVARILRAATQQGNGYGADDPEVRLLAKVGPSHADVLVEPLLHPSLLGGDIYLIEALKSLAGEEHKKLVLDALPIAHELVVIVRERGWTEDSAPTLLKVLADRPWWTHNSLPTEWIEAVADLKRPETYESLKTYFYYGHNRYHTWMAIRGLPELALDAEVERLWTWARELDDPWVRGNLAAVAAHYGHLDALARLFDDPESWPAFEVIARVTPYRTARAERGEGWRFEFRFGKPKEEESEEERAKKWFALHRDRLVFDKAAGKYRVKDKEDTAPAGK
jgi:hypothetical protein